MTWHDITWHHMTPTHSGLLAVLHELGQVEHGLCDLRNVVLGESLFEVGHHVLLVRWTKLHPTWHKRCIEQLPGRERERDQWVSWESLLLSLCIILFHTSPHLIILKKKIPSLKKKIPSYHTGKKKSHLIILKKKTNISSYWKKKTIISSHYLILEKLGCCAS